MDRIARRYGLSPFSPEVDAILSHPQKRVAVEYLLLTHPTGSELFPDLFDAVSVLGGAVIAPYKSKGKGKIEPLIPEYTTLSKKRADLYDSISGDGNHSFDKKQVIVELRSGKQKRFIRQD